MTDFSGMVPVPSGYRDRVDLEDGYAPFPTATGSLDLDLACGVLVGDREIHNATCAVRARLHEERVRVGGTGWGASR